jgi:lysophospholipase L1-like esterase
MARLQSCESMNKLDKSSNWVFLGDSLTEGVGAARIGYVSALAGLLTRDPQFGIKFRKVHEFRARSVDPNHFNRFLKCNVAGFWRTSEGSGHNGDLWLWNLASEGTTIEADAMWLPLIKNIKPEVVIIFRGSLETIVRPVQVKSNCWPRWVPNSWRGYASMDPRCYFSTSRLRAAKQKTIDYLKQKTRLRMLHSCGGEPLLAADELIGTYARLLSELKNTSARILMLGLLPVSESTFIGSAAKFSDLNSRLQKLAVNAGVDFLDWGQNFCDKVEGDLVFRDGFHPTEAGAERLASMLLGAIVMHGVSQA